MSTKPNQGKNPDQDRYGGYAGYQPRKATDDPYGAYYQPSDNQQGRTAGTAGAPQSDPNYVYGQQQQQQQYKSSGGSSSQQQKNSTYQPPSSVGGRSSSSGGQATRRLKSNHAAALSYLGIFFTGLFFFFWGRNDRLVRFSAAQSIVLFFPLAIVVWILQFLISFIGPIWFIGWIIGGLLSVVSFLIVVPAIIVWLFLMVQAYRGVEVKLPYVGNYAERLYRLFSPKQKKAGY